MGAPHRRLAYLVCCLAVLCIGLTWSFLVWRRAADRQRIYRIGFQDAPPRQFVDPQGHPYGSAIDTLNEAARRAGLRLQWILVEEGPDRALAEGWIDLWPVMNRLPERSHIPISEPYTEATFWLMAKDTGRPLEIGETAGQLVAITRGLAENLVRKSLPRARAEVFGSIAEVNEAVCGGKVFAGIIAESVTHASIFKKPEGCSLRMSPIPGAQLYAGIGASPRNPAAVRIADLLRQQIAVMVQDGTYSTISLRWYGYPTSEAVMVERLAKVEREVRARNFLLAAGGAILLGLAWTAKRLGKARRAAENATRVKSEFLAHMSHELRTPLNVIIGYSEMLQEEATDLKVESMIPDLGRIHTAARHLLTLINDVLDLSRIEAGKTELASETLEIRRLVEEALSTIEPVAKKNGNQLVARCSPDLGTMQADAMKFRQSLLNLLSNACKFTRDGTVALEVVRENSGGKDWIDWRVRDTGIGISPEQIHKLFQAFSQADSGTTRKYGGTGLGLAISQKFCQMMGGMITVSSELGKGSTFTIRMPASANGQWPDRTSPDDARDLAGVDAVS